MKYMLILHIALIGCIYAHQAYYEEQRQRTANFDGSSWATELLDGDSTFENPMDILKLTSYTNFSVFPPLLTYRQYAAMFLESTSYPKGDVDYYLYNKTTTDNVTFIGYPLLPACKRYENTYYTVGLMGPLSTISSAPPNQPIFHLPPPNYNVNVPTGYGIRTVNHQVLTRTQRKPIYHESSFTFNKWFLPFNYSVDCIENTNDPTCDNTNVLLTHINVTGAFYWFLFEDTDRPGMNSNRDNADKLKDLNDVAIVTGTIDGFLPSDFQRLAAQSGFTKSGRSLHAECLEPYDGVYEEV